jgi:Flp pilus assembly protein TadB
LACHRLKDTFAPVPALLTFLADFIDPNAGPDQSGDFRVSPTFFIIVFGLGFAIGTIGHLAKSRVLVAAGVALIFIATILLPIGLKATR